MPEDSAAFQRYEDLMGRLMRVAANDGYVAAIGDVSDLLAKRATISDADLLALLRDRTA